MTGYEISALVASVAATGVAGLLLYANGRLRRLEELRAGREMKAEATTQDEVTGRGRMSEATAAAMSTPVAGIIGSLRLDAEERLASASKTLGDEIIAHARQFGNLEHEQAVIEAVQQLYKSTRMQLALFEHSHQLAALDRIAKNYDSLTAGLSRAEAAAKLVEEYEKAGLLSKPD